MNSLNIENHMVLGPIPGDNGIDAERDEMCIVCDKEGCLSEGRWLADSYVDMDEGVPFLDGTELYDATDTEHGWVCSDSCRAQAVYQFASADDRKALDAVLDACRVLQQYGKQAASLMNAGTNACIGEELVDEAHTFVEAAGEAEWANRETRETRLEEAIRDAAVILREAVSQ